MASAEREAFVQMCVLNEVCDDYESFDKITEGVISLAAEAGITPSATEIESALRQLVRLHFVKPFVLSEREPPKEVAILPGDERLRLYYFFQTEAGKEVHSANLSHWPASGVTGERA